MFINHKKIKSVAGKEIKLPSLPRINFGRVWNFLLGGHRYHHSSILKGEYGPLLRWIFNIFFSHIHINEDDALTIKELSKKGMVIYTLKGKSRLEYLFFNWRYSKEGLPRPSFAYKLKMRLWQSPGEFFRIALCAILDLFSKERVVSSEKVFRKFVKEGKPALIFLFRQGILSKEEIPFIEPIILLIEEQLKRREPIFLIPKLVVYQRPAIRPAGPLRDLFFGDMENPGRLHKLILFLRKYKKAVVCIAPPINLLEAVDSLPSIDPESIKSLAYKIRRELIRRIDSERRIVSGPVPKPVSEVKEAILEDPEIKRLVASLAEREGKSEKYYKKRVKKLVEEIAADPRPAYFGIWKVTLQWVWNNIYDGLDIEKEGISKIREAARKGPLVIVPCHKSHIDYMLISYILFVNNMNLPYVAAGINLAFWPLGHIFRRSGAYFIRRTLRGDRLYPRVLASYIQFLIKEGIWQEFFIEGGRSRTGKLYFPKLGLLSMLVRAYEAGAADDLIFVPVYIGYDRIIEEGAYIRELIGHEKEAESLSQLIRIRKFLKKRYGKVYVRFADPISLRDYMEEWAGEHGADPQDRKAMFYELARRLITAINERTVTTPFSLVAAAVLSTPGRGFTQEELHRSLNLFKKWLEYRGAPVASTLENIERAVNETLNMYLQEKLISRLESEPDEKDDEVVFTINRDKRLNLEYYKNNIIHYFLPAALASSAVLSQKGRIFSFNQVRSKVDILKDLFKYEFIYDSSIEDNSFIEEVFSYFRREGYIRILGREGKIFQITERGIVALPRFAGLIENYIESYWIMLKTLSLHPGVEDEKKLVKKAFRTGQKLYLKGEVARHESLSTMNFGNALKFYKCKGWIGLESSDGREESIRKAEEREAFSHDLKSFLWWFNGAYSKFMQE